MNPSPLNYTLGRGVLYFDKYNAATGKWEGERHLGNAPEVTSSVSLEKLDHYSSMSGLKAKDHSIILEIAPTFGFTLDEMSPENTALQYMADMESVTQAADDDKVVSLESVMANRYYDLDARNVGITVLSYDGGSAIFNEGATLTGGTSGTTATILQVIGDATSGVLYLSGITGAGFDDDETLSDDGGTPGAAVADGTESLLTTALSVEDTDAAGTFYTAGTDFTVDSETGRIFIVDGGAAEDKNLTVTFGVAETTYNLIKGFVNSSVEGRLRFVSDNAAGKNRELMVWRASITPTGDNAQIGEDWSQMQFEVEVLKDATNHPDNPYLRIIMDA